jgi:phage terminase Nu1 subunit (DNA packaging protein)
MQGICVKKAKPTAAKTRGAKQLEHFVPVEPAKRLGTIAQLAKRIGLSVQRVTVLIDQGVIPRAGRAGHDLDKVTLLYIEHLRAQAAGRGDGAGSAALSAARSRLTEAKAKAAELQNQIGDGLYVLAADVRDMMASTFADQRSMMLAVPGKVADRGQHTDRRELFDILSEEIREVLTRLCDPASYNFGKKK